MSANPEVFYWYEPLHALEKHYKKWFDPKSKYPDKYVLYFMLVFVLSNYFISYIITAYYARIMQ